MHFLANNAMSANCNVRKKRTVLIPFFFQANIESHSMFWETCQEIVGHSIRRETNKAVLIGPMWHIVSTLDFEVVQWIPKDHDSIDETFFLLPQSWETANGLLNLLLCSVVKKVEKTLSMSFVSPKACEDDVTRPCTRNTNAHVNPKISFSVFQNSNKPIRKSLSQFKISVKA